MTSLQRLEKAVVVPVLFFLAACSVDNAGDAGGMASPVRFKADGTFRIAQFTDIHVHFDKPGEPERTRANLERILRTERPDLAVLTGDIVNAPAPQGWRFIAEVFSSSGTPWTVVYGNHEDEDVWSRQEIHEFLRTQKGYIGSTVPGIAGVSNFIIPVRSHTGGTTAAMLYFFDSHGYPADKKLGDYDWIKADQIRWYREQSTRFTTGNGKRPYPALAFLHIPLPEYKQVIGEETHVGVQGENVCSPDLNSGLFSSLVEMQDVMGVFCGHDHDNNSIGILNDIALAYGQVSGYGGYGKLSRGARIIELSEGHHRFTTWIRNEEGIQWRYEYPAGL